MDQAQSAAAAAAAAAAKTVRFLEGGGELGAMMRAKDWSRTALGPAAGWPSSLKVAVRIMLSAQQPMWIGWGPQLIKLYNDAYRTIVGGKHPQALGQPASAVWREIWDEVGPRLQTAMQGHQGTGDEALLLVMERNGYPEETYYTFSYSPVPDDDGEVGGIVCTTTDDTQRVVRQRQLALLRELALKATGARSYAEACALCALCLESGGHDLPVAMLYLLDASGTRLRLAGVAGIDGQHPAVTVAGGLDAAPIWPLRRAIETRRLQLIELDPQLAQGLPTGPWQLPVRQAIALPIRPVGAEGRVCVLVAGLNPLHPFDDDTRDFLDLLGAQIGASLGQAQAYEQERERAENLAELDRAKTLFLSNVSHEFRTPLTLMLGPLDDLLESADALDGPMRSSLTLVQHNGRRLLKMVNSLLDFSRIEAGRAEASYEAVDLSRHTADLASQFRAAVEKAGLRLQIDCAPLREPVYVDREMWEKIVLNLLSNAFKHTFDGEISVSLQADADTAVLRVTDTGIGIAPDELPRLFDRFHRVQGARSRTHEGTGIGLALVHELARLHGGFVQAESTPNVGSSFIVRIPMGSAHLDTNKIRTALGHDVAARGTAPFVEEALRWNLPGTDDTPLPARSQRPRIVLADDNADMREYIQRLLEADYEVCAVGDGRAALRALAERRPALLLTDVMMPLMDGFALLRAIRQDPQLVDLPVIVLSGRAGEDASSEGLEARANDYLVKPFSARDLLTRVASQLARSQARDEAVSRERALLNEAEGINQLARELTIEHDSQKLLDKVIAIAVRLTGAECGAFFYDGAASQASARLHAAAGAAHAAEALEPLRHRALVEASLRAGKPLRVADLHIDPQGSRDRSQPGCDMPVASFLAVPVVTSSGELHGALLFGHSQAGVFTERAERYAVGIAVQAAVALDNARLYERLRAELAERARTEAALATAKEDLAREVEALASLHMLSTRLMDADGLTVTLQAVLHTLIDVVGGDCALLRLYDPNTRCFEAAASIGSDVAAIHELARLVAPGDTALAIEDIELDARGSACRSVARRLGIRALHRIPLRLSDGSVVGLISLMFATPTLPGRREGFLADLCARHAAAAVETARNLEALRASERLYRAIGESIRYGVWTSDAAGRATYASPSLLELTGMTPDQFAGDGWLQALHPDDVEPVRAAWAHCVHVRGQWERKLRFRGANGSWHPVLGRGVPVYNDSGGISGWAGINLDFSRTQTIEDELREADRRKDEFLATLAHELRNPLAPLRNGLRIMRTAPDNAQIVVEAREMMERQLQQMVRLVDDLLDISRISRGRIELKREVIEVEAVVRNAIETTRAVFDEGQHAISLRLPPAPTYVDGDMTRLSQVVVNLLNNAAKYSAPGQGVSLSVHATDTEVMILVRDKGIGIPAPMLTRVFDMFTQINGSLERSQGGLGIGLSIVKRIVKMHGGRVEARSAGIDLGSEFRVWLPRETAPLPRRTESRVPQHAAPAHLRVLVVDDNIDAAQSLATILQFDGCDTQIAHDGEAAIDLARSFLPDAVILDIGLPQVSGYEVCRRLRQHPWGSDIVIIALTGWGQDEHRRRSHEAGFDHHLVKPVEPTLLSGLLEALRKTAAVPSKIEQKPV